MATASRTRRVIVLVFVAAMWAAVCPLATGAVSDSDSASVAPTRASAVVADISPGTNPYHEVFRRPGWTEHPCTVIPTLPCDMPAMPLTLGDDYTASLQADLDSGLWDSYERGVVHWVPGTNLLLLTLRSWEQDIPDLKDGHGGVNAFHGLGTSGSIAQGCPDCYVLVVQDRSSNDGEPIRHIAANLPWVDFVASTNIPGVDDGTYNRYAAATFDLAATGRLFFAAAGNYVVTGATGYQPPAEQTMLGYDLPPWVVLVGGSYKSAPLTSGGYEVCNAVASLAGRPPEIMGEYAQWLPAVESVRGYKIWRGTSFATPQVAARYAHALIEVRRRLGDTRAPNALWAGEPRPTPYLADGRLHASELRHVLSRTAQLYDTTAARPKCIARQKPYSVPASLTPWVDLGWGYLGTAEAEQGAAVITGEASLPKKPAAAEKHMALLLRARQLVYPTAPVDDNGCSGVVTPVETPAGTYYLDARLNSFWIYHETNGQPGLQTGGTDVAGDESDPCAHDNPDQLIF
jgi:hypothetical protein